VERWVGEGRKVSLVGPGASDAAILQEAIEELQKRKIAGAAMFLVKVKAHQEEPQKPTFKQTRLFQ